MDEDEFKKRLGGEGSLPQEEESEEDDPFAVDGLGHKPEPEDDRGGDD